MVEKKWRCEGRESKMERKKTRKRERDRSVCRLVQSHCSTLEFQTRDPGQSGEQRRGKGGERRQGERRSSKLTLEANRRQAREEVSDEIS